MTTTMKSNHVGERKRTVMRSAAVPAKRAAGASFDLTLSGTPVGHLAFRDGTWGFVYDAAFRTQRRWRPIVGFRDTAKEYRSERLWPFFRTRIPSLQRPDVRAVVRSERIDPAETVAMLRRFGCRTIANPFELEPAER